MHDKHEKSDDREAKRMQARKQKNVEIRQKQKMEYTLDSPSLMPSPELAAIVGHGRTSHTQASKKFWAYLKRQDKKASATEVKQHVRQNLSEDPVEEARRRIAEEARRQRAEQHRKDKNEEQQKRKQRLEERRKEEDQRRRQAQDEHRRRVQEEYERQKGEKDRS